MRYLGLLYDSLREALDSKIMYVTFALSFCLIFLVATLHFRPVTLQDELERITSTFNWLVGMQAQPTAFKGSPATAKVADFKQLNKAAEPWNGDYQFTLVLRLPAATFEEQAKRFLLEELAKENLRFLNNLKIEQIEADKGREFRLTFISRGTRIKHQRDWPHQPSLLFGAVPLSSWLNSSLTYWVYFIENHLVNAVGGWVIVLISIIVTAGFVPSIMQRGSVELLLVKPISRVTLLLFKYLGGLTFVFVNSLIAIGGVWLMLGLRTGIWTWSFPVTVLILTAFFAILYAVSTLVGVLTQNSVVCIFLTCLVWLVLFAVGVAHASWASPAPVEDDNFPGLQQPKRSPLVDDKSMEGVKNLIKALHFALPRTDDLGRLTTRLLSHELLTVEERRERRFKAEEPFSWGESLAVSGIFVALMLGLACWRFAVRDY